MDFCNRILRRIPTLWLQPPTEVAAVRQFGSGTHFDARVQAGVKRATGSSVLSQPDRELAALTEHTVIPFKRNTVLSELTQ